MSSPIVVLETLSYPENASIYDRVTGARSQCAKRGIEAKELRFSFIAFKRAKLEEHKSSNWDEAMSSEGGTYCGLPVVIERPRVADACPDGVTNTRGDEERPSEKATVCIGGIGALGRWVYIEA